MYLFIILMLISSCMSAHDVQKDPLWFQALEKISASYPIHIANKALNPLYKIIYKAHNDLPASAFHQKMNKEAMIAMGIPESLHLPVYKMDAPHDQSETTNAQALPGAIYINEELLKFMPYGLQRFVHYHEPSHSKFHDHIMQLLTATASGSFITKTLNKMILSKLPNSRFVSIPFKITTLGLGFAAFVYTFEKYHIFSESRADKNAVKNLQCSICVKEKAQYCDEEKSPDGYLSGPELINLDKIYNPSGKKCVYHMEHGFNDHSKLINLLDKYKKS